MFKDTAIPISTLDIEKYNERYQGFLVFTIIKFQEEEKCF